VKAEYINPFLSATVTVFDTMLGCELSRHDPFVKEGFQPEYEISGIIGLSGKAKGTVVLSLNKEAALQAASTLLHEKQTEMSAEVTDAVGELANVIAGQAKAQLEHLAMSVSLPTVVTGTNVSIEFPSGVSPICIPFECSWGKISVEVGLVEQPVAVGAGA